MLNPVMLHLFAVGAVQRSSPAACTLCIPHAVCSCSEQMASALAHLHRHGVAHLDVKPDNIYLQELPEEEAAATATASSSSTSCPAVRYKLGDFGQATRLDLKTPAAFDEGDSR